MNKTVAIIGAGRIGGTMGRLLKQAGYTITGVATRGIASAEKAVSFIGSGSPMTDVRQAVSGSSIVLIATPDSAIADVCETIAPVLSPGTIVLHTSGAHTLDLLDPARTRGSNRAVIHPLQSLPSMEQGVQTLPGSYFRIEADADALDTARELVKALGGIELVMPKWSSDAGSAALYHAGAVAVSNYFVALMDYGLEFYAVLGADKQEALKAILPLVRGTLHNIETLGTTDALTGPISRGDAGTVKGHLDAMVHRAPHLLELYQVLAKRTIGLAAERGLAEEKLQELKKLLE